MRAGRLRTRVEIQRPNNVKDSFGQSQKAWATINTVWASIDPLNSREYFQAQQVKSDTTHKIMLRSTDIKTTDRIKSGPRIYELSPPLEDEQKQEVTIYAKQI